MTRFLVLSFLLIAVAAQAGMQEGLSGEQCLGRFGWNRSDGKTLEDGLLFNGVDENGLEACIGLGDNQFRMWRMDILTPEAVAQDPGVKVKWLNWIAKEIEIRKKDRNYNLTYSLASPGIILDTSATNLMFQFKTDMIGCIAYQGDAGVVAGDISSITNGIDGNILKANWILCFGGKENKQRVVPFLLLLSRPVDSIKVEGNTLKLAGTIGRVVVATPFGLKTFSGEETEGWGKGLPADVVKRCEFWSKALLQYPINGREYYEVDEENMAVTIEDRYEYLRIKDAWHTVAQKVAPMPPIISFARTEEYFKERVKVEDSVKDLGYPTWYGPLEGNIGKAAVRYILPSAFSKRVIALRVPGKSPFTEFMAQRMCKELPAVLGEEALPKLKRGEVAGVTTDLSMFLWMNPETRERILAVEQKNLEELFRWVDVNRVFFKEPSTGKGFYVLGEIAVSKTKDEGSFRIDKKRAFDMDAFSSRRFVALDDYVMWSADQQLVKNNWERIKKDFEVFWAANDWAIMSSSEVDAGSVNMNAVDCTWDVLSGLEALLDLAKRVGDTACADGVQYIRARQLPIAMLKLALQWNYLPQYGYTFADNQFFVGAGELDKRYRPNIPYWIQDTKKGGRESDKYDNPAELPWLLNDACTIWSGGSLAMLSEMAPATTRKYLQKIDELCPGFDDGPRRISWYIAETYFPAVQKTAYQKLSGEILKREWKGKYFIDRDNQAIYDNHLFLALLLRDEKALSKKVNTFCRGTFQEQMGFNPEQLRKEFFGYYRLAKLVATAGYIHSPVSLGEWGTYKVEDGVFQDNIARIDLASTDKSPLRLRMICREKPVSVLANSVELKQAQSMKEYDRREDGWCYQPGVLWIKSRNNPRIAVEMQFASFKDREDPFHDAALSAGNLIYNPGFETTRGLMGYVMSGDEEGDVIFNRWQSASPTAYYRKIVSSTDECSHSGKMSAKLVLDRDAGIFQDVKVETGKVYEAEFYYKASDTVDKELRCSLLAMKGGKVRQVLAREDMEILRLPGNGEWEKVNLRLTGLKGTEIIRFVVQYVPKEGAPTPDNQKAVYIDDVSLRVTGAAPAADNSPVTDQETDEEPGLIFYAPFDKGLDGEIAGGDGRAGIENGLEGIVAGGRKGNCLRLTGGGVVSYYSEDNFKVDEGTVDIWIKPDQKAFEEMRNFLWGGCVFWTEFDFTAYHRFSAGLNLDEKNRNAFYAHFETENGLSESNERTTFRYSGKECEDWKQWHHLAATWKKKGGEQGKDQTSFYFDGALVKTVNDASLAPVVRGIMKLGHSDPHRQYDGLLDELRIYGRVLSPEEIKKLYDGRN